MGFVQEKTATFGFENRRKYFCLYCPYSTSQLGHMKYHQVTHTGARPFKCNTCHKCFSQKSSLGLHQRRFHHDKNVLDGNSSMN